MVKIVVRNKLNYIDIISDLGIITKRVTKLDIFFMGGLLL